MWGLSNTVTQSHTRTPFLRVMVRSVTHTHKHTLLLCECGSVSLSLSHTHTHTHTYTHTHIHPLPLGSPPRVGVRGAEAGKWPSL